MKTTIIILAVLTSVFAQGQTFIKGKVTTEGVYGSCNTIVTASELNVPIGSVLGLETLYSGVPIAQNVSFSDTTENICFAGVPTLMTIDGEYFLHGFSIDTLVSILRTNFL